MQKMYSKPSRRDNVNKNLAPSEETIRFLLDYSKALSVLESRNKKFDIILN